MCINTMHYVCTHTHIGLHVTYIHAYNCTTPDALARLVFFKLLRFGRKQQAGQDHASSSMEAETSHLLEDRYHHPSNSTATRTGSADTSTAARRTAADSSSGKDFRNEGCMLSTIVDVTAAEEDSGVFLGGDCPVTHTRAGAGGGTERDAHGASRSKATMLAMHKAETADSNSMYLSAHLLMSAFDQYSDGQGNMNMQQLLELLKDGGLAMLDQAQVSSCLEESCGIDDATSSFSYGAMIRCLRACAHAAFQGDAERAEDRMIRSLRRSLAHAHVLYDTAGSPPGSNKVESHLNGVSAAHESKQGQGPPSYSNWMITATEATAPSSNSSSVITARAETQAHHSVPASSSTDRGDGMNASFQGLSLRDQKAFGALAEEWAKKEVSFRKQREKAAADLEKTRMKRIAENADKYRARLAVAEIGGGAGGSKSSRTDRQPHEEQAIYMKGKITKDMEEEEKLIEMEFSRAHEDLAQETRVLEHKIMRDMEESFTHLKGKIDARKKLAKYDTEHRLQGAPKHDEDARGRMHAPLKGRHANVSTMHTSYSSSLDTTTASRARANISTSSSRSLHRGQPSRPAMEELQQRLSQIFRKWTRHTHSCK
jgi:hypothetical protein